MTCCSTNCMLSLQFLHNAFRFAFGASLSIKPCAKAVNDGSEVTQQILSAVLCLIDHFNRAFLCLEQGFQVAKAETSSTVLVLHHNRSNALVCQQSEKLGTRIIDP